jgi:hypothetical protein
MNRVERTNSFEENSIELIAIIIIINKATYFGLGRLDALFLRRHGCCRMIESLQSRGELLLSQIFWTEAFLSFFPPAISIFFNFWNHHNFTSHSSEHTYSTRIRFVVVDVRLDNSEYDRQRFATLTLSTFVPSENHICWNSITGCALVASASGQKQKMKQ